MRADSLTIALVCFSSAKVVWAAPEDERLITLGASVTETVCLLTSPATIVAVDTTSRFPPSLSRLPRVGYLRTLSAEGILALSPTRVLASRAAGPKATLSAIEAAGVAVELVPDAVDWAGGRQRILKIGELLARSAAAQKLVVDIDRRLEALSKHFREREKPKVLFLFAHGRSPVVAGRATGADAMIRYAGGTNAMTGFEGYKPPSAEAIAVAAPDAIITTPDVIHGLGGVEALQNLPGLSLTPAVQASKIYEIDAVLFLSLGPRTADAAEKLASMLYPRLSKAPQAENGAR